MANDFIQSTGAGPLSVVQPGRISTVAGVGCASIGDYNECVGGYSGDGGLATSANLNHPVGVAVDGAGNVYIADIENNRVRKVTASTGVITTVVGNGTGGYSGDGGPATGAELSTPTHIVVDGAGNLYIADMDNNCVREVQASTGVITTVAGNGTGGYSGDGGPATIAELYMPYGLALDSAGNLYIADYGNNRVRRVDAETGLIATVAGNGTASSSGDGARRSTRGCTIPKVLRWTEVGIFTSRASSAA